MRKGEKILGGECREQKGGVKSKNCKSRNYHFLPAPTPLLISLCSLVKMHNKPPSTLCSFHKSKKVAKNLLTMV